METESAEVPMVWEGLTGTWDESTEDEGGLKEHQGRRKGEVLVAVGVFYAWLEQLGSNLRGRACGRPDSNRRTPVRQGPKPCLLGPRCPRGQLV